MERKEMLAFSEELRKALVERNVGGVVVAMDRTIGGAALHFPDWIKPIIQVEDREWRPDLDYFSDALTASQEEEVNETISYLRRQRKGLVETLRLIDMMHGAFVKVLDRQLARKEKRSELSLLSKMALENHTPHDEDPLEAIEKRTLFAAVIDHQAAGPDSNVYAELILAHEFNKPLRLMVNADLKEMPVQFADIAREASDVQIRRFASEGELLGLIAVLEESGRWPVLARAGALEMDRLPEEGGG